jgi:hypothetical protein
MAASTKTAGIPNGIGLRNFLLQAPPVFSDRERSQQLLEVGGNPPGLIILHSDESPAPSRRSAPR